MMRKDEERNDVDMSCDGAFWLALDRLAAGAEIVIDRPRGSRHPDFPEFVYELDYGYLRNTVSSDGEGVDVWLGSDPSRRVTGAVCTVDLVKRDVELKLLLGCTADDCSVIRRFYHTALSASHILLRDDTSSDKG